MRYLVTMNFSVGAVKNLNWAVFSLFALAQCTGVPLHAQSGAPAAPAAQSIEGGMLLPAAAPMTTAKPAPSPDLRTVLLMQKTRQQEAAAAAAPILPIVPERQLSSQERTELREQLRHQPRHHRDVSSH